MNIYLDKIPVGYINNMPSQPGGKQIVFIHKFILMCTLGHVHT